MEYVRLGQSGLKVSKIVLGAMSFGDPKLQTHGGGGWVVGRDEALKVLKRAWDLGINFFDTANVYSMGKSEEILGEFLQQIGREEVVVATKVYFPVGPGPNDRGLSRKHIWWQIKESLRRLKTDYVDLYQIHRWDYDTPIEETLSTLTDLVRHGLVRYIGASSMWTWQFAKAIYLAEMKGYEKFISTQTPYNLLYREEEREMIPFCKAHGITHMAYSPHAAGLLSGAYYKNGRLEIPPDAPERLRAADFYVYKAYVETNYEANVEIIKRTIEVAKNKGVKPAQIALAWVLHKGSLPIIGTSKVEHLEEAVEALDIKLSDDEIKYLEEPYKPKPVLHITQTLPIR
ncbi:MAG: aldo/keto reductase [Thermoproteus sp. AZ2]|jgi:aryl-alcohol dehydrogenase (NADP+)|uniref:Aldo/keto reductase n=1 Tax=Thermoproteus sp. AZ2 TaxID=1609232 RepID=A0ACC6V2K1_9CREN|nr:MAG: aldo/keto reductase [Thermoproteus sp. AZ2]